MKTITEKLAYIQGLAEGLKLDTQTPEGKILAAIIDLLEDVTDTVSRHETDIDQIFDELDAIDEDLTDVEDALLYDDDDDEDDDDDDDWDDDDWDEITDDEDYYDEENPLYEVTCPKCGKVVTIDEESLFSDDCRCPNCGTKFEIVDDLEEDKED
jgi:DNA-directed RNA polymerase subunit RPC12/RpoP